jgi:predicted nucleic acid-binding protein
MLGPAGRGAGNLRLFVQQDGLSVWFMDNSAVQRAFELMEQYADHPMDLADASLLVAAEVLPTHRIFTIDRQDFATYRVRRGHRFESLQMLS